MHGNYSRGVTLIEADIHLPQAVSAAEPKTILIGGTWFEAASGETFPIFNPSTGREFGRLSAGEREDVDRAVAAAREAFDGPWADFKPRDRQNLLLAFADLIEEHYDELNRLDAIDMGRPIGPPGIADGAEVVRYYAGWPTKIFGHTVPNSARRSMMSYTLKEPIGVIAAVIPWNAPIISSLKKIAPVLATGCTLVLKPAEDASLSVLRIVELLHELEIPRGVVNVVTGVGSQAGAALAEHPDVDKIAFIGSTATAQSIIRAATGNLKRVSLELGGKSPNIVFDDADLEQAVPTAAMGVFANTGQVCCAGTRIFVQQDIYDDFVSELATFAAGLKVGDSLDPATQIGPLISERQLSRVCGYLDSARQDGVTVAAGGARIEKLAPGYFVPPTVFADVNDDMTVAREEIFGPVASVLPFSTEAEVVRRANATPYGLAAGVWSKDSARVHRMARRLRAGTVWLNSYLVLEPPMPFGGYKMSGWGRDYGIESLDEFLNVKAVWASLED